MNLLFNIKSTMIEHLARNILMTLEEKIVESKNMDTVLLHPFFEICPRMISMNNLNPHRNTNGIYKKHVILRIFISKANLGIYSIKLMRSSVEDLVPLTKEYNFLCLIILIKFGGD